MKIGILTFHDGINHGAYLQAYALQRALASNGAHNVIINYRSARHFFNEYKKFLIVKRPKAFIGNVRKIKKFRRCPRRMPLTTRYTEHKASANENFDLVAVGHLPERFSVANAARVPIETITVNR